MQFNSADDSCVVCVDVNTEYTSCVVSFISAS